MSEKVQKEKDNVEIDEIERDSRRNNKVNATIGREEVSWLLNLILNQKSQREIAKDIADGILDFNEIEEMFPWKYVQELRQGGLGNAQNFLNRFKHMTDDRVRGLLSVLLSRKGRDEVLKLIADHALGLSKVQKSYLWNQAMRCDKENVDPRAAARGGRVKEEKVVERKKKSEKKEEETKKKAEKTRKARAAPVEGAIKLKKSEKRVCDVNDGDKVVEAMKEISEIAEKRLFRLYNEKTTSSDLSESLTCNRQERFEESSEKSRGDLPTDDELATRGTTKKTAKSKSLPSDDAESVGVKKNSRKVGKGGNIKNKRKRDSKNTNSFVVGNSTSNVDDAIEESEGSGYRKNETVRSEVCGANEMANVSSSTTMEQEICANEEQKSCDARGYNFNIQDDTSTPKKFNYDAKLIRVKEEPKDECSFDELDYQIDYFQEKVLHPETEKLATTEKKKPQRARAKPMGAKKIIGVSKIADKAEKQRSATKKEARRKTNEPNREKPAKDTARTLQQRRRDRHEREKKEMLRKHEKKIQKTMVRFSDQVVKLVKGMGYLEENERSASSSSECSSDSEEESSYSTSSGSCSCSSCSCCDSFSSDEYSEYTLCSCSGHSSSDSNTDSEYTNEE